MIIGRWRLALAAAVLLLTACGPKASAPTDKSSEASGASAPSSYGYADELAAADASVAAAQAAIARGPVVWPQWQALAQAQLARAKLTGSYEDYDAAENSLAQAFSLAGTGGPYLVRAQLHYALHRLDQAEADLDAAEQLYDPDRHAILGLRADLAFYRGQYPQALSGYRQVLAQREDVANLSRLAIWHARMGHRSEAAALFGRADALYRGPAPHPRAWLALQQGLLELDGGRWSHARAHYEYALRLLPGWWLAREHIAEVMALTGETAAARRAYEDIVADTGQPEFMDALAALLPAAEAAPWRVRAGEFYRQRLQRWPEAVADHALDHFLVHGDPARALELARQNARLRPFGQARSQLAEALLRNSAAAEAAVVMDEVLASGWNTGDSLATAARAYAASKRPQDAERAWKRALSLNPKAGEQYGLPTETWTTAADRP